MPRIRFNYSTLTASEPEAGNRHPFVEVLAGQRHPTPRPDAGIRIRHIAPVAGRGWPGPRPDAGWRSPFIAPVAGRTWPAPVAGWRLPR
jgi:hypothetical protein